MVATVLLCLFSLAAASPVINRRVVLERRDVPSSFASLGAASKTDSIKLRFALASQDIPGLQKALLDVSTPSSANYGKHLTLDEVNAYAAPSAAALTAVQNWLSSNNVNATSSGSGDWLTATVSIAQANTLLGTTYQTFQHSSGRTYARTLSYSLPAEVVQYIDEVHPSTTFNSPISLQPVVSMPQPDSRRHRKGNKGGKGGGGSSGSSGNSATNSTAADSCDTDVTPECLQTLYNIPATPATQASNSIAVAGFIDQFAQKADLQQFLTALRPDLSPQTTFSLETLDGGSNTQGAAEAGVEANLDVQYTVGVATKVPVVFVSVGEQSQDGDLGGFLDIVNFISGQKTIPQVMTTSYGENEADISPALATKLCNAYMALGARGTSVLFASGDGGVEGGSAQSCTTFQAAFPAGCPYLTAVGAVHGTAPETASTFSSGGFSNVFGVADYQKDAVAGYLTALGNTNKGLFNVSGRGYPDVAAQGENVQIVSGGTTQGVAGTSCSSPIFASVVALINDQLIAAGKSPLGFLNPFLYENAAALNDVTTGSNPGCGTQGFPAKTGWDPVTGLGTPNFAALKKAAGL
ncbi:subtilisin-like protein [Mycena alexandri]|uniref:tripeptidyl-peptidase II n=1 Tax=Mycena alexandri TaxID=1745969 RepID=A0AAD6RWE4_9AGAR|nr:subtilisin-like protein [Mycena alexandri]